LTATADDLVGVRLLVLGVNYAPEETGIAPYTTGMCEHLAAVGAEVTAVTGIPHYPQWKALPDYRHRVLSQRIENGVQIWRARHYVPASQTAIKRGLYEISWMPGAIAQALRRRVDAVIAISPSLAAMPIARFAAGRSSAPWAVVVQDLMGAAAAQGGVPGGGRVAGLVGAIERNHLNAANLVGVIGEGFAAAVVRRGVAEENVRLLPNWTHIEPRHVPIDVARKKLRWQTDTFTVVHTGNMGSKQDLGNVIHAAAEADRRNLSVTFVLVGDGSQRRELQQMSARIQRIRFVAPLTAAEYPYALAAADLLLVNERRGMVEMSLPSKLSSYFAAGKPVIAAVPKDGWTASVLIESRAAVQVAPADSHALLEAIVQLASDKDRRSAMAAAARKYAVERYGEGAALNRYREFAKELVGQSARL
jgi:colanic acid biosynthesis glycosyl transferase WcaI